MNSQPEISLRKLRSAERARDENKTLWLRHFCHQGSRLRRNRGSSVGSGAVCLVEILLLNLKVFKHVMITSHGSAAIPGNWSVQY